MQVVKKIVLILFTVWLGFLIFMPKVSLYNTLQERLAKKEIMLNEEHIDEGLFSLALTGVSLYVKGINVAHIEKIDIFTLLFYTRIEIENMVVDEVLHRRVPEHIEQIKATYMLVDPKVISVQSSGSFGVAKGEIKLKEKKVHLDLVKVGKIEKIQSILQKDKRGWYYEKNF